MEGTKMEVNEREPTLQSAAIGDLAKALAGIQGKLTNPPKSKTVSMTLKTGGTKRYSFAPLPDILDQVRPILSGANLALTQLVVDRFLETRLLHASGQWIGCRYPLPALAGDPQGMGSAITYARRYSLSAILGIAADDDDDGETAGDASDAAVEAADQAALEQRRKESEARLEAAKAAGRMKSAHTGEQIKPGQTATPPAEPPAEPKPEIGGTLGKLMARDGITPEQLKAYYVGKGHLPETVDPSALPEDYVSQITKVNNWARVVASVKGGK